MDQNKLEKRLKYTKLIIGDVKDTIDNFLKDLIQHLLELFFMI